MYLITIKQEFDYCIQRGFNPLLDVVNFKIDIRLRIQIQKQLFGHTILGRGNIPQANDRFFRWLWENKPRICEETMRPLGSEFSSVYCSHILTRGAHPEMSVDPRNINMLSPQSHNRWENGDRESMRIYPKNQKMIELLLSEYNQV